MSVYIGTNQIACGGDNIENIPRDYSIKWETSNRDFNLTDFYINDLRTVVSVEGTNNVNFTIPENLGTEGNTITVDNDGVGVINILAGTNVTLIGYGFDGTKTTARMDGSVDITNSSRITLLQKKNNVWRIDGNYEAV